MSLAHALDRISTDRVADLTLELVRIASPTGDTRAVSERFAVELSDVGMQVRTADAFPATPVVIGRLAGEGGGPTLILNGHLDTVPIPHAPPERRDGRVFGRGATDMKGPLAAAVEAVRAVSESGVRFRGDLVLCAHGLHEAPGGHAEDLARALADGGIQGDAAVVLELAHDALPVAGLGSAIYRARYTRAGIVTHELMTAPGTPNPVFEAAQAVLKLQALNEELVRTPLEHTGPESVFVARLHAGDFFNRFPTDAWIEGTRRYAPERRGVDVGDELRRMLEPDTPGLRLEFSFEVVREGFRTSEAHPLVEALQEAYAGEHGRRLPITGARLVADAPLFHAAGIPCVYHGLNGDGAHSDVESVPDVELQKAARVYLRLMASYLGLA